MEDLKIAICTISRAMLLALCISVFSYGQADQSAPRLEWEVPLERSLAGGEAHQYKFALTAGQFLKVVVEFKGVAGKVPVYGPDNQPLTAMTGDTDLSGSKHVALIIPANGHYRIEVRSSEKNTATGRYRLLVAQPRTATEADRHYASAQQTFDEAEQLSDKATAESRQLAIAKFQASLTEWRAAGDQRREAETLHSIAKLKRILGDSRAALPVEQEALTLTRALNDRRLEIEALNGLGTIYFALSDFQQAMETLRQALPLCRELGDREIEITLLNNLGAVSATLGASQQALDYYVEALALARQHGFRPREARLLSNIGVRYLDLGEPRKATEYFQQALVILRSLGLRDDEAGVLHNLSGAWLQLGEYQQALDFAKQALALAQSTGYRRIEAGARVMLEQIYDRLGDLTSAEEHLQQGLAVTRSAGFRNEEAILLNSLGALYKSRDDLPKALEHLEKALMIHRMLDARANLPSDLIQLGAVRMAQGEIKLATENFREAVTLSREIGLQRHEISALLYLAKNQRRMGETAEAMKSLQLALELSRTINYVYLEAQALGELALASVAQEKYSEAQTLAEEALRLIESARATVGSQNLRASYRGKSQPLYEAWIESLMQQNTTGQFVARAFEASEHSRARSLIELLNEAQVIPQQDIAPELAQRASELRQKLTVKSDQLARVRASDLNLESTVALRHEIAKLTAEFDEAQTRIRQANPRYAALTAPAPLKLDEIQKQALDANTLLLEYSLGERRSYLFAVTPSSIQSFTLPGRREIETAARLFYRLTTEQDKPAVFRSAAESRQWAERNDRERVTATANLSRMLLGPVAGLLGKKRLLIVGDGILHYVPFAALSEPGQGEEETERRGDKKIGKKKNVPSGTPVIPSPRPPVRSSPLIINHEVLTLPSASVLAMLRRETATREPAHKTIAVLADPVFEENDERINNRKPAAVQTEPDGLRAATMDADDRAAAALARLPFTRREAEAIIALVPESERKIALGLDANRALAVSRELADYRYLHFATHGVLNTDHPELSGLAFSLFNERGERQNGFLRGVDAFNMRLSTELVTLSGCRTALGKEISGEGLVGLTRGFMYAGARRVLAGLWNVNDAATAELMRRFYKEMLGEKHLAPAAALRVAQVSMLREPRWRSPFYWAAFVLQGEW